MKLKGYMLGLIGGTILGAMYLKDHPEVVCVCKKKIKCMSDMISDAMDDAGDMMMNAKNKVTDTLEAAVK